MTITLTEAIDTINECVSKLEGTNLGPVFRELGNLAIQYELECAALRDALLWCSGAPDFQEGGIACEGWRKGPAEVLRGTAGRALLEELLRLRAEVAAAHDACDDQAGLPKWQRGGE